MSKKDDFYYYSNDISMDQDPESFFKYMEDKTNLFEEEINLIYSSLNDIIKGIQAEYPSLEHTSIFEIN